MKYLVTSYKDNKEKQEIESKGLYCYDLRHSDEGGEIATIEKSVLVNRIGSIITDKELKFGNKVYNSFIDFEEFSARNTEVYTIEQLQYKQKEKANENSSKVITGERESTIKQLAKENKCNVRDIEVTIRKPNSDENRDTYKYILEECAKFNLKPNMTNKEVREYYKELTLLDNDKLSIKDKKIYLYNNIVKDMIKDGEITQQEGKDFMSKLEKKIKNKTKER